MIAFIADTVAMQPDYMVQIEAVIGVVVVICTLVGGALAKFGKGTWNDLGHFLLAFGADIGKARKRTALVAESLRSKEPEVVLCVCKHSEIFHVKQVGQCAVTDCTCDAFNEVK